MAGGGDADEGGAEASATGSVGAFEDCAGGGGAFEGCQPGAAACPGAGDAVKAG